MESCLEKLKSYCAHLQSEIERYRDLYVKGGIFTDASTGAKASEKTCEGLLKKLESDFPEIKE